MNKVQCRKASKDLWGPLCDVVNVSHRDRHQRFGIVTTSLLGPSERILVCLGHGDSYQAAFDMAAKNPVATSHAEQWKKAKEDLKEFGQDPKKYFAEKIEEIKNGTNQFSEESEGSSDEGRGGSGEPEGDQVS